MKPRKEVNTIRSDNDGEYVNRVLEGLLKKSNIRPEKGAPHTPQQNGVAKRANKTLMEATRIQLYAKQELFELWGESIVGAVLPTS